MAGRKLGEFTEKTRRFLAGRAGYKCSFPDCRLFTIGPHSDGQKTVNVGTAAHIKGAAPGSARYDPDQTPEQRKHISNGIWMCGTHGTQIDNDEAEFSVDLLRGWKELRESEAKLEYANPTERESTTGYLNRPNDIHRIDTDGKYRWRGIVVSFDPWLAFDGELTMVKLAVGGELDSASDLQMIAVLAVQAYGVSVGLRGNYLHIFSQMRNLRLSAISQSAPAEYQTQFDGFVDHWTNYNWDQVPGMEGMLFDLIAGDVKGTGEWTTFMFDVTDFFPGIYSWHVDGDDSDYAAS